jgi:hypothetical protein
MNRWVGPRGGVHSKQFKTEAAFCDAIEAILSDGHFDYEREYVCWNTDARADFKTSSPTLLLEAKIEVSGTSFDRAIGQAARYKKLELHRVWIVLPDDVAPTREQRVMVASVDARIVRLGELHREMIFEMESQLPAFREVCDTQEYFDKFCEKKLRKASMGMLGRYEQTVPDWRPQWVKVWTEAGELDGAGNFSKQAEAA